MSIVIHLIKPERAVADKEKARVAIRHAGFLFGSIVVGPPGFEPGTLPALRAGWLAPFAGGQAHDDLRERGWAHQDSNLGPSGYEPVALTN